ncbi:hypothetical protein DN752_03655 [Echinicola strongylocentroti]|uniref:Uncharacterized protein n=1 Tax=Echinicola strongylocentroti TaxID=1795355 RepID=A0A2Z4IFN7_9BACT|nr:hypothetical protein [Echinicola strongylocentroti]AWW29308.1 hypothetical protein DN752_03655 [Echinicola strongylocentroti]
MVKRSGNKRKVQKWHPIAVLVLTVLLLCSPCSVRNSLQEALGATQTQVLNKSKAVQATDSCFAIDDTTAAHAVVDFTAELAPALALIAAFIQLERNEQDPLPTFFYAKLGTSVTVPYYILYQNFKTPL